VVENINKNYVDGVMVFIAYSPLSTAECWFEPQLSQTKDYKIWVFDASSLGTQH
jgi:hypothetical protein